MCRGASRSPTRVGLVDSATTRWAIQSRGLAVIFARRVSSSSAFTAGPITSPLPPEASTGLKTKMSIRSRA